MNAVIPPHSSGGDWVEFTHDGHVWCFLVTPANHTEWTDAAKAREARKAAATAVVEALNRGAP